MDMHFTPAPETELSEKVHDHLTEILGPTTKQQVEKDRVTDLLFDAANDGNRAEFHRLWTEHVLPLSWKAKQDGESG